MRTLNMSPMAYLALMFPLFTVAKLDAHLMRAVFGKEPTEALLVAEEKSRIKNGSGNKVY